MRHLKTPLLGNIDVVGGALTAPVGSEVLGFETFLCCDSKRYWSHFESSYEQDQNGTIVEFRLQLEIDLTPQSAKPWAWRSALPENPLCQLHTCLAKARGVIWASLHRVVAVFLRVKPSRELLGRSFCYLISSLTTSLSQLVTMAKLLLSLQKHLH